MGCTVRHTPEIEMDGKCSQRNLTHLNDGAEDEFNANNETE